MKVLVLGATGTVGSQVVRELHARARSAHVPAEAWKPTRARILTSRDRNVGSLATCTLAALRFEP